MSSPARKGQETSTPRGSLQAPSASRFPDPNPEIQPTAPDVKRKGSRIPFLGRVRKKLSSNTVDSEPGPSDVRAPIIHLAPNSHLDLSTDEPSAEAPPRPSQSSARTTRTLGSKIVSHLTPKKSRSKPPSGYASDTLFPHSSSIRPSLESAVPRDSRPTTPRQSQPTITVSHSPTPSQLGEFQDLFTRPRRKSAPKPSLQTPTHSRDASFTRSINASTSFSESESSERRTRLSANSPPISTPPSAYDVSFSSQSDTDTGSRTSDRVSTQSSRSSHLLIEPLAKSFAFSDDSDATTNGLSIRRQRASTLVSRKTDSILSKPPNLPLPVPNSPETSYPTPPPFNRTTSEPVRPRAQTLASIPTSHPNISLKAARSISSIKLNAEEIAASFDVESASPQQLKIEFKKRNGQYRELADVFMSAREEHIQECFELEQRIALLERDLVRKDKEIQGLTWLMKSRNLPPSPPANSTSFSDSETRRFLPRGGSGIPSRASTVKHPQHRHLLLVNQDDSAPESLSDTSGWDSASSRRPRRTSGRSAIRSSLPQRDSTILSSPLPPIPSSKRSSVASLGSTVSSSSIPSSSITTALTSIPESPPPTVPSLKTRDPAIAAAIQAAEQFRDKEDRRSSTHRSRRKPAPAAITLPPTPAEAYVANLRRSGPASSIAQVLDTGKS